MSFPSGCVLWIAGNDTPWRIISGDCLPYGGADRRGRTPDVRLPRKRGSCLRVASGAPAVTPLDYRPAIVESRRSPNSAWKKPSTLTLSDIASGAVAWRAGGQPADAPVWPAQSEQPKKDSQSEPGPVVDETLCYDARRLIASNDAGGLSRGQDRAVRGAVCLCQGLASRCGRTPATSASLAPVWQTPLSPHLRIWRNMPQNVRGAPAHGGPICPDHARRRPLASKSR